MKITCNSCGSKYTIADAKVQGKKVKVRCKGCKESILVDGTKIGSGGSADEGDSETEDSDAEAASAPGADESMASTDEEPKKDLWSVNLSDDDSRDMTLDELIAGWKAGTVTSDAYVWKDGMGDWKPILEVGELKLKLGSAPKKGGVISSASPAVAAAASGGMDDLFGGVDHAANEPSEVDKPMPTAGAGKPTGARNDSSVLFSLDSLNSGGGAPQAPQASSSADALFAGLDTGSASLTNNTDLLTAPAKEPPPAPAGNRAAPVIAPAPSKGKGGLIAAILGAAVIIGGAVVFMGSGGDEAEADAKENAAANAEKSEEEKKAEKELAEKMAKLEKMEAELKKAKEEAKKDDKAEEEEKKKKEEELAKEKEEAEKKAEEEKKAAEASGSSSSGTTSSGSKPSGTSTSTSTPSGGGGGKFDVGAARAALQAAAANAAGCGKPGGPTGSGKVQVTFSTSGRVTSATVIAGPFGGTAVGGCVASTFRRARVPAFSGSPQTVAKSFAVR